MARTRGRAVRRRQQAGEDVQSLGTRVARARGRAVQGTACNAESLGTPLAHRRMRRSRAGKRHADARGSFCFIGRLELASALPEQPCQVVSR